MTSSLTEMVCREGLALIASRTTGKLGPLGYLVLCMPATITRYIRQSLDPRIVEIKAIMPRNGINGLRRVW
jgi:hypothetical protein